MKRVDRLLVVLVVAATVALVAVKAHADIYGIDLFWWLRR